MSYRTQPTIRTRPLYRKRPHGALGYDFVVNLPVVGNETITLPLEQMISDAAPMIVNAAWPPLQTKIEAELATVQSNMYLVAGVIVAAIFGAAYWTKKSK